MASVEARADFLAKRDIALRLMATKGIRWRAAPPIYHFLWACHVQIRPPLFSSFLFNLIFQATFGASLLGLMALTFGWLGELNSASRPIVISIIVVGSVLSGLIGAWDFRYAARKHSLPTWSELKDEAEVFD
jgi:hypothetical protein